MAQLLTAFSIIVMVIAFIAYFFIGAGKFLSVYFPFLTPNSSALLFFGIVMIYTVAGGFYGVIYTDLLQAFLVIGLIVFVTIKAMMIGTPEYYQQFTSADWRTLIPSSWETSMPAGYENMQLLSLLIICWIISNIFQGFALPFDAWTSQRYYAAKNERESGMVACQWIVLFGFRFLLMMGMGILAVGIKDKILEPEMALNAVMAHYVPIGVKGMLFAALLAAAMSVLSAITNSSGVYFVRDLYQKYIRPTASQKHLVKISYITTAVIMALGAIIGWKVPNVNSIWAWICMGLFTGVLVPNILKWFWWRFNGLGYAFGMGFGIVAAVIHQLLTPNASEYATFFIVIAISAVGTILGVFIGKPTDMETLIKFYKVIRPFGFWGPVRQQCDPEFVSSVRKENVRDLALLGPACLWQVTQYWMWTALVAKQWASFIGSAVVVGLLSCILYQYWYKNLANQPKYETTMTQAKEPVLK